MQLSPSRRPEHGRGDLLVLVLLLAAGGFLAFLPPEHTMATAARLRSTVLLPVLETHETLRVRARLRERLADLEAERDSLARELVRARSEARQSRQLRDLLELPDRASPRVILASLEPGRARAGGARTFLLRTRSEAPLRSPTAVFTAGGLVGVVRSVGGGAAAGDFWTHPDFRVSVRTETGDATGIVRPSFDTEQPGMLLEGAPYQQDIPSGTLLYTSGLGGIYPAGLPVGTVRSVSGVESGWEKSYRVEPAVRPGQVDAVLVWLGPEEAPGEGPSPAAGGEDPAAEGVDPADDGEDPAAEGLDPAAEGADSTGGGDPAGNGGASPVVEEPT